MIVYFADRQLNILGQASTELPKGLTIADDLKSEDVETGVAVFECWIPFDAETRAEVESCTEVGNYILRSNDDENEFYTIIDVEIDTKNQEVYIYAEDAGLDLLNEMYGEIESPYALPIEAYLLVYAYDSGFQIGVNEAKGLTRKLKWDGEDTAAARIASVAKQFGDFEVSYSFEIEGLSITKKYINVYKKRGHDTGAQLRLNFDVDRIVTKKSISNLATALRCKGGTPESEDGEEREPITLEGYVYDDGDFYVSGKILKSRNALKKWSRYIWPNEPNRLSWEEGHITKPYSYDTTDQAELCAHAVTELKKLCEIEVNYEVDIPKLPDGTKLGDRITIIDDDGDLYLSTRILALETSIVKQSQKVTLGEYLIKTGGVSQQVSELAEQFAKTSFSLEKALEYAKAAGLTAEQAKELVDLAGVDIEAALAKAIEAYNAAQNAQNSANTAQGTAVNAQAIIDAVNQKVTEIETSIDNAQNAANNAQIAADEADAKADEAKQAAAQAVADAAQAKATSELAQSAATTATTKANAAQTTANEAKANAATAQATADAAKLDAEQAQKDIDALAESLETVTTTMEADYARKTELTETEASLQSQISQNAAEISSTTARVQTIDETANNAQEQAQAAQAKADSAQAKADQATADAEAAQTAADQAAAAAASAQSDADTAKAAAATAKSVADKAEEDLAAAKADLETVSSRVDATEEEITAAQQAVTAAQTAADNAQADAEEAAEKAAAAQLTAATASSNAANAQATANDAASNASAAQALAEEAKGDASTAQTTANQAAATAAEAQRVANNAVTNAANAQSTANAAALAAEAAQTAADEADAKAAQAAADLAAAQQNLSDITSRADATEDEVEAAQADVIAAQAAAERAEAEAEAAQATADTAKANATAAQTAANNAKTAADNAQAAADDAQQAADDAQAAVDALAVRVTTAETKITQNSERIALMATKEEVAETLGDFYTKEQTEALLQIESASITSQVSRTYATKQEVDAIEVGGRNLFPDTDFDDVSKRYERLEGYTTEGGFHFYPTKQIESGVEYTISAKIRGNANIVFYEINEGGNKANFWIGRASLSETEYALFAKTFVVDAGKTFQDAYICTQWGDANTLVGDWFEIEPKSLKLEKGNKATDWTPAPEDVESGIETAQSTADTASESAGEANERITTAETLIQQLSNCISMLVTDDNGESLMTQTENGWTFSMKETYEAVSSLTSLLETLQQETGDTQATVEVLKQAVTDHGKALDYVNISTYENEPCIELGESDSNFKLLITNTRIMFMNGGNVPTYINTNGIVTQNIEVQGEIVQGGYVMLNTADGGWGLLWKGVSS